MSGRPLRFLGLCVAGWTATRIIVLWPTIDSPEALRRAIVPMAVERPAKPPTAAPAPAGAAVAGPETIAAFLQPSRLALQPAHATVLVPRRQPDPDRIALAMVGLLSFGPAQPVDAPPELAIAPPLPGTRPAPQPAGSRWSGSAWLLLRGGSGIAPGLGSGQLGGAQAGIRLAYTVDEARRLSLVARVATPLKGIGREASVGIEWQPSRLPLKLVVEQRIALDRSHGGPAIGVIGGTGPAPLVSGFDLATYGQAGAVSRARLEPFAEGAARVSRTIATSGKFRVDLGAAIWGGAQREAARLDIGPSLGTTVPLGKRSVRLSLDWRERVAGSARPGSGAALTLGSDF
jgi:hypothetical protein